MFEIKATNQYTTSKLNAKAPALKLLPVLNLPILKLSIHSSSTQRSPSARVAILVGEGVDTASIKMISAELSAAGFAPSLVGCNPERVVCSGKVTLPLDAVICSESLPEFSAMIIPDGEFFVKKLENNTSILDFVRRQYHHCHPILAIGAARRLLAKADVLITLPSGLPDPTIILSASAHLRRAVAVFKAMLPA